LPPLRSGDPLGGGFTQNEAIRYAPQGLPPLRSGDPLGGGFTQNEAIRYAHFFSFQAFAQASLANLLK